MSSQGAQMGREGFHAAVLREAENRAGADPLALADIKHRQIAQYFMDFVKNYDPASITETISEFLKKLRYWHESVNRIQNPQQRVHAAVEGLDVFLRTQANMKVLPNHGALNIIRDGLQKRFTEEGKQNAKELAQEAVDVYAARVNLTVAAGVNAINQLIQENPRAVAQYFDVRAKALLNKTLDGKALDEHASTALAGQLKRVVIGAGIDLSNLDSYATDADDLNYLER